MKQLLRKTVIFLLAFSSAVYAQYNLPYPTYRSFDQNLCFFGTAPEKVAPAGQQA